LHGEGGVFGEFHFVARFMELAMVRAAEQDHSVYIGFAA